MDRYKTDVKGLYKFQSPRGDFGFLKLPLYESAEEFRKTTVSIPSRGFWFFEDSGRRFPLGVGDQAMGFNPLAGILVF